MGVAGLHGLVMQWRTNAVIAPELSFDIHVDCRGAIKQFRARGTASMYVHHPQELHVEIYAFQTRFSSCTL